MTEASAGRGLLEELMRDVMSNTAIPDLSELFVRAERTAQESGWLMGADSHLDSASCQRERSTNATEATRARLPVRGVQSLLV